MHAPAISNRCMRTLNQLGSQRTMLVQILDLLYTPNACKSHSRIVILREPCWFKYLICTTLESELKSHSGIIILSEPCWFKYLICTVSQMSLICAVGIPPAYDCYSSCFYLLLIRRLPLCPQLWTMRPPRTTLPQTLLDS